MKRLYHPAGLTVGIGLTAGVAMTDAARSQGSCESDGHDSAPDARLPRLVVNGGA